MVVSHIQGFSCKKERCVKFRSAIINFKTLPLCLISLQVVVRCRLRRQRQLRCKLRWQISAALRARDVPVLEVCGVLFAFVPFHLHDL